MSLGNYKTARYLLPCDCAVIVFLNLVDLSHVFTNAGLG